MNDATLGVIVGHRGFFPARLVTETRQELVRLLAGWGIQAVMLEEADTNLGAVSNLADARRCAELFRSQRDRIAGVVVVLPDFGDERSVAEALRLADLRVPVLVQACPDEVNRLGPEGRRDSLCGKISVCNNLRQYGIPFSLTSRHTMALGGEAFRADLTDFQAVCRVVGGLRRARLGAVGARPAAFNTVRYSERILQAAGATVVTLDLSELIAMAGRIAEDDARLRAAAEELRTYALCSDVPADKLELQARVLAALRDWTAANELDATAIQCWSSIQQNYGVNLCAVMSLLSEKLQPSACEVDVTGALTMYALQLASGRPAALVDWNNNYGEDADKCVFFHCGNWARSLLQDARIGHPPTGEADPAKLRCWGAMLGRSATGPFTFARISTDDVQGRIRTYVGEGRLTNDPLDTYGCRGVAYVDGLQDLLRYICREGFEHHGAICLSRTAGVLEEAFGTYMGWEVHRHGAAGA